MNNYELLYQIMGETLKEKSFLKETGITPGETNAFLYTHGWHCALDELFKSFEEKGRFNAIEVANICQNHIPEMKEGPFEGWPKHTFFFLRDALFPGMADEMADPGKYERGRRIYQQILRGLYSFERAVLPFDPTFDLQYVDERLIESNGSASEYAHLKKVSSQLYIYEFMRIASNVTPFNTLGHMFGVHYVAMLMAYQLKNAGVSVDLGLISGAAAGHDIGKYGCRKREERRVPYLHYYYSDVCFRKFNLPEMAHIAANHSTWDLELEDLSVESLLLIYSDFRVKSEWPEINGVRTEKICFYTLDDSYAVILGKLDNVDEAKKHRYEKVFSKLKDFENFMKSLDVITDVPADFSNYNDRVPQVEEVDATLLEGKDNVEQFKFRAIDHNLRILADFRFESGYASMLESARSVDWTKTRTYLNIFAEYSIYMPEKQKLRTLEYLYDLLSVHEADIRIRAAEVLGKLVGTFREEYKKEVPEDISMSDVSLTNVMMFDKYLDMILYPTKKLTDQHREWIMNSAGTFVNSVLNSCKPMRRHKYMPALEKHFLRRDLNEEQNIALLTIVMRVDPDHLGEEIRETIQEFFRYSISCSYNLLLATVIAQNTFWKGEDQDWFFEIIAGIFNEHFGERSVDSRLNVMYLENLKSSTHWIQKIANIALMEYYVIRDDLSGITSGQILHIATHLANIVKVSEVVDVRQCAGNTLVRLTEYLSEEQRNEIAVELFNGLEIGDYQFSRYIPEYLGQIILYLSPNELDESLRDHMQLLENGNEQSSISVINTIKVAINHYSGYQRRFGEDDETISKRKSYMMGIILKAYAGYMRTLSQEALLVIGSGIFASPIMTDEEKADIYVKFGKKICMILDERSEKELDFYNNAASLNHIYRFISHYETEYGEFRFPKAEKIAFFPGAFDPFSLGHKALARAIRDAGFEVYLAIDEFSWSKKTQPHLERRRIMLMSTAQEENMYLFTEGVPVNIDNPADLKRLKDLFAGREVYIAVGTDVIRNASCYKAKPVDHSIHSMNHLVFERVSAHEDKYRLEGENVYPITGKIVKLSVKKYFEDISSTRIRENINLNRDISNLLDRFAQRYIYEHNLYLREPTYKHVLQAQDLIISEYKDISGAREEELLSRMKAKGYDMDKATAYLRDKGRKTIIIESEHSKNKIQAAVSSHAVRTNDFYREFKDVEMAAKIREASHGRTAVIGFFAVFNTRNISNISQILLTEVMADLLSRNYTYAVYHPVAESDKEETVIEVLRRHGFINIAESGQPPLYAVDMSAPTIIFRDVRQNIKNPLNRNPRVVRVIENAHNRLLHTMTALYPGQLVLSFNTSAVYNKIIAKIAELNGVSIIPDPKRRRGPYMCVPFGKCMSDVAVPNTVTKGLHTEKYFKGDLSGFRIAESPGYSTLENQVETLKSFHRPIILVEDLLHRGYRMQKLLPTLDERKVEVKAIVSGVITGKAKDMMEEKGRRVEAAYYIPTINIWLNERDCYPFIGGDGIDVDELDIRANEGRHVNLMLPYAYPKFIGRTNTLDVLRYSMTCLENTKDILEVLEEEYLKTFEKKLTLKRLGEVISSPKLPYRGKGMDYDDSIAPSEFIKSDLDRLMRIGGRLL